MPRSLYFETFGCQMNKLDSELVLGELLRAGYALTDDRAVADVILYNTCSVRGAAEERVYSHLGELKHAKRARPDLVIGVLGCMAQREGEKIRRRAPHVDLVCGTHQYREMPALLRDVVERGGPVVAVDARPDVDEFERGALPLANPHSAFVLAMKGCDCRCTFCVVPLTRGTELSRPIAAIVEEVAGLAARGVIEVTLLGQNVTSYGKNLSPSAPQFPLVESRPERSPEEWEVNLAGLLRAVAAVPGIRRVRFLTGHPAFATRSLFAALRDEPKICPYFHAPAQSGSDRILRRMKRGYTRAEYLARVAESRALCPRIEWVSDFIVGFPGETDADFRASLELVEAVGFVTAYMFTYSPRPGTPADKLADDVPQAVKDERLQILLDAQKKVGARRNAALVGRAVEVLVEGPSRTNPERWTGRIPDNRIVVFDAGDARPGELRQVRVEHATPITLFGRLAAEAVAVGAGG
ncbi:MAG: tRNA (N6-isopentenyl adenosine(37)-C2)-methylthiotransferase MiaB [Planctomycetes bacterium]|nr:tRNA (N6-isopentenyl adenosine(37)-C2)-methylthiotransferase MiaB [Planctomycetota bacterium]